MSLTHPVEERALTTVKYETEFEPTVNAEVWQRLTRKYAVNIERTEWLKDKIVWHEERLELLRELLENSEGFEKLFDRCANMFVSLDYGDGTSSVSEEDMCEMFPVR